MSEILREQARWRKEKTPIVAKYVDDHAKLLAEVAGRGFLALPGYAYDLENALELATKLGLSELNYKILSETVDREMKQLGIDYNLAYRNSVITWEIERQVLMSDWESEYAWLKEGLSVDENTLELLAIEVSKRGITLLAAKTALELSMEADRKALTVLDATTAPYEVQIANAKLLTTQKKLTLIPIVQSIITKEQELLVIEQGKAAEYTALMAAEQTLAAKKQTVLPALNELASLEENYALLVTGEEIPKEKLIAGEKLKQANDAVTKADYTVQEMTIEVATETKKLQSMDARRSLQELQFADDQILAKKDIDLTTIYDEDQKTEFETVLGEEKSAAIQVRTDKTTIHKADIAIKELSATTLTAAEKYRNTTATAMEIDQIKKTAALQAATKITASLEHVIG
jgi:hypothetical protein